MSEIIESQTEDLKESKQRTVSESSEGDFDPQFKPVITLPEVEISTNEENEIVWLKLRAKLYRFDTSSDPSEWKERGTGEMKILQHRENNSIRIVMRRDKTFKVCANHFLTPWMNLKPCAGSERAFVYTVAADFADEKPKSECLAIKFANVENANSFKNKFEEATDFILKNCSLYIDEYKEVAEKFEKLEVKLSNENEDTEKLEKHSSSENEK